MERISVTIDGREIETVAGRPLLEVAGEAGIFIPHLCYLEHLPPFAGCRTCSVEVEGMRGLQLACNTRVAPGMVVKTNTPQAMEAQRAALLLIQANHPDRCLTCHKKVKCGPGELCQRDDFVTHRCLTCAKNKRCELLSTSEFTDTRGLDPFVIEDTSWYAVKEWPPVVQDNPFLEWDNKMCILCARCIRACDEIRCTTAIGLAQRATGASIVFGRGGTIPQSTCDFCGACIDACPTATLMERPHKWAWLAEKWTATTCSYCSVGCRLNVGSQEGKITIVKPLVSSPVSGDQICVRGRFHYSLIPPEARLTTPLIRRDGILKAASWEEALEAAAGGLAEAARQNGDDIGCLVSSRCTNEEGYLLQKLARTFLETRHIDQSSLIFHRVARDEIERALGPGFALGTVADLQRAECILVVGGDVTASHPVAALKIKQAVRWGGAGLIVLHPKGFELTNRGFAPFWLRHRPGTETALLNSLTYLLLTARSQGGEQIEVAGSHPLMEHLQAYQPDGVAEMAGVSGDDIQGAGELLFKAWQGRNQPGSLLAKDPTLMGVVDFPRGEGEKKLPLCIVLIDQAGPPELNRAVARSAANLALAADRRGGEGAVIYLLSPEANALGLAQVLAALEPGGHAGLTAHQMLSPESSVKAMLSLGDNPVMSLPGTHRRAEALRRLKFLVAVDYMNSDTAKMAHVVLPGLSPWEKEGTYLNDDGYLQQLQPAASPPLEARPDWWILCQLARRIGEKRGKTAFFAYQNALHVTEEMVRNVPRFMKVDVSLLQSQGFHYLDSESPPRTASSYESVSYLPSPTPKDTFTLITGRPLYSSVERAIAHCGDTDGLGKEDFLLMNPGDADSLGVVTGDSVVVESASGVGGGGVLTPPVRVTQDVPTGVVFLSGLYDGGAVQGLFDSNTPEICRVRMGRLPRPPEG